MSFIKKENLTIVIGEYNDQQGNPKKQYKTIGELVTMMGNEGQPYQFFKLWGPGGVTEGKVFDQQDNSQQQPAQSPPQQAYAQPTGQQQPAQQFQPNNGGWGQ